MSPPNFFKIMSNISHYYRCLGCSKHHDAAAEAVTCCAVVQEIFECKLCGDRFAAESWAVQHISQFHRIPNGEREDVRKIQTV